MYIYKDAALILPSWRTDTARWLMAGSVCLRACVRVHACVRACVNTCTHTSTCYFSIVASNLSLEPSETGSVDFTYYLTWAMFVPEFLTCSLTLATFVSVDLTCICTRATFVHVVLNCLYVGDICACLLGLTLHLSDVCAWNQATFMFVVLPCTCRCMPE